MKKLIIALIMMAPGMLHAAGGGQIHLESASINLDNDAAKQRGAKYFVNYCLNCHSLKYERWQRMQEFGLSIDDIREHLMPANAKPGDLMTIAMKTDDAKAWFGNPAPDLTLETRLRGEDWVYTYLKSFYLDDSRPFGVNNTVFDKVGMPHVLWELQGWQEAVITTVKDHDGRERKEISLELVEPGLLEPHEYDRAVRDLVNFLDYMGEPAKYERRELGVKVIMFLLFFLVVAYLMKRDYWKDVH